MKNSLATSSQLNYLLYLYRKSIGESRARWYTHQLKDKGMTVFEASKEIKRLQRIRMKSGPTAMKPENWEEIQPSQEEIDRFWESIEVKLIVDKP